MPKTTKNNSPNPWYYCHKVPYQGEALTKVEFSKCEKIERLVSWKTQKLIDTINI